MLPTYPFLHICTKYIHLSTRKKVANHIHIHWIQLAFSFSRTNSISSGMACLKDEGEGRGATSVQIFCFSLTA